MDLMSHAYGKKDGTKINAPKANPCSRRKKTEGRGLASFLPD